MALVYTLGSPIEAKVCELLADQATLCESDEQVLLAVENYCNNNRAGIELEDGSQPKAMCLVLSVESATTRLLSQLALLLQAPTAIRYPRIILLSTFLTWGKRRYADIIGEAMLQSYFDTRLPDSSAVDLYALENVFRNLTTSLPGLQVCILYAGLIYGSAGLSMEAFLRALWSYESEADAPILESQFAGANHVPMIHHEQYAELVHTFAVVEAWPSSFFCVPVSDGTSESIGSVCNELALRINGNGCLVKYASDEQLVEKIMLTEAPSSTTSLWSLDLTVDVAARAKEPSSYSLLNRFDTVWGEFLSAHSLEPISILVTGNPKSGKTEVCKALAAMLKTEYVNVSACLLFVLKMECQVEEGVEPDADALLKIELTTFLEAKMSEGKKPAGKKGEVEAPMPLDVNTLELTEALVSSIAPNLVRRCIATMLRRHKVCSRRGYVLDVWEASAIQSVEELNEATTCIVLASSSQEETTFSADQVADSNLQETMAVSLATTIKSPRTGPELIVEMQCPDAVIMSRLMVSLGIAEGTLAKASKENQAIVKALESSLAGYAAKMKPIVFSEEVSSIADTQSACTHSHETIQNLETSGMCGKVLRIDAANTTTEDVCAILAKQIFNLHSGKIGWLTDISDVDFSVDATSSSLEPAKFAGQTALSMNERCESAPEASAAVETLAAASSPKTFSDISASISDVQGESRELLLKQADELQQYLLINVLPFLTKGMIGIARDKPTDPIRFIAEHLRNCGLEQEKEAELQALERFNSLLQDANVESKSLLS